MPLRPKSKFYKRKRRADANNAIETIPPATVETDDSVIIDNEVNMQNLEPSTTVRKSVDDCLALKRLKNDAVVQKMREFCQNINIHDATAAGPSTTCNIILDNDDDKAENDFNIDNNQERVQKLKLIGIPYMFKQKCCYGCYSTSMP